MKTQTKVESKVSVLPKLAFVVVSVIIGVGLGAVAFNSLVPNVLTPLNYSDASTSTSTSTGIPPIDSSIERWYLVFGGNKVTYGDFNRLRNMVRLYGSNVKIILDYKPENNVSLATTNETQARLIFQCEAIEFSGTSGAVGATCVTNNIALPENKTVSAWATISFNGDKMRYNNVTLEVTTYDNDGKITNVKSGQYQNPLWNLR